MDEVTPDRLLLVVTRMADERENEFLQHNWWNLPSTASPYGPPAANGRALVVVHWKQSFLPTDWDGSAPLADPVARVLAEQVKKVVPENAWRFSTVAVAYHRGGVVDDTVLPREEFETAVGRVFAAEAKVKTYSIGGGAPTPLARRLQPLAQRVGKAKMPLSNPEVVKVFDEAWVEVTGLSELEAKLCLLHMTLAPAPAEAFTGTNGAPPRLLENETLDRVAEGFYGHSLESLAEANPRYASFRDETVRTLAEKLKAGASAEDRFLAICALRDALLGEE